MKGHRPNKRTLRLTSFFAGGLIVTSLASSALQPPQQASAQAQSSVQRDELRLDSLPDPEQLKDRRERDKDEYEREKEWRKDQAERAREQDKRDAELEREWDKDQAEREK